MVRVVIYNLLYSMKNLVLSISLFILALSMPKAVLAQENCVQVYGGGVVCGEETHEPVDTDLGDINPAIIGGFFLTASATLFYFSRKVKLSSSKVL